MKKSPGRGMPADSQSISGVPAASGAVFTDPSGRRWRHVRWVATVVAVVAITTLGVFAGNALQPPHATAGSALPLTVEQLGGARLIGEGPFERILRVDRSGEPAGVDPFTGERVTLTDTEVMEAGDAHHVLQRYGSEQGAPRTIALTFDDGPDALVTPRLLDLLSREQVPATFFVLGNHAAAHPDIIQRMLREGHAVGVHSLTHPNLGDVPEWREHLELVDTERTLRAAGGHNASVWRAPYADPAYQDGEADMVAVLRAQRLGYTHVGYNFDTLDWLHAQDPNGTATDIPLPDLSSGAHVTVLAHDAGGPNRERTVEYVHLLIEHARANGYTFHTLLQLTGAPPAANAPVQATAWDGFALAITQVLFGWPEYLMRALFALAILLLVVAGGINTVLALVRHRRRRRQVWPGSDEMRVPTSVVLAAYNEEAVIARTLETILASVYPLREIIVVDDGSTDATASVVRQVQQSSHASVPIVLVQQENAGKAMALNRGLSRASGDVIVTLDADTIIAPDTITHLIRHFAIDASGRLGAVAGVVRVGNRDRNLLTRWQALEYLTQIGLDRSAQDALGAISIIPGACAAWRKSAILGAGGYSTMTLAEDCDLALTLHQQGWRVTQDDEAVALTEAPENVDDLLKQRVRWTYGTLQAMYKNRRILFRARYGALGWWVLPSYLLSILVPLVFLPFIAVMTVIALQNEPALLLEYFALFLLVHVGFAAVAVRLMREDWTHLLMVPVYRLVYEPLRAYLLYKSVHLALKGGREGWNKIDRTGALNALVDPVIVRHELATTTPR
ncbi:MAG: glycosyltransferase [Nigerium sp.]|nr:glycosyltransferase [Nigerium sp.]